MVLAWKPHPQTGDMKVCPACSNPALEGEAVCTRCGTEPGDDSTWREACRFCHVLDCAVAIDKRFPAAAAEAYAERGLTVAHRCAKGQAWDMRKTGWCLDRAVRHAEWSGEVPLGLESDPQVLPRRRRHRS